MNKPSVGVLGSTAEWVNVVALLVPTKSRDWPRAELKAMVSREHSTEALLRL